MLELQISYKGVVTETIPLPLTAGDTFTMKTAGMFCEDDIVAEVSPTSRLPVEYQEVEYLESTGAQYVNSGIIPKAAPIIRQKNVKWITIGDYDRGYMLAAVDGSLIFDVSIDPAGVVIGNYIRYGSRSRNCSEINAGVLRGLFYLRAEIEFGPVVKAYNTAIYTASNYDFSNNSQAILLTRGRNAPSLQFGESEIEINGEIVFLGVPCYRKSDLKTGMYDLILNTFIERTGTAEFIVGPDVN